MVRSEGGGKKRIPPRCQKTKIAFIFRKASVCGIMSEKEGDTDLASTTDKPGKVLFYMLLNGRAYQSKNTGLI